MNTDRILDALETLKLAELYQVQAKVNQLIVLIEGWQQAVMEERQIGNKTYRLEHVRCGKEGCKCQQGPGHGPYWYAYWSEKGRTHKQYIGKRLKTI